MQFFLITRRGSQTVQKPLTETDLEFLLCLLRAFLRSQLDMQTAG